MAMIRTHSRRVSRANPAAFGITVVKDKNGGVGWRAADTDERPRSESFGKIYGVEAAADARTADYQRSLRVIQEALREMAVQGVVLKDRGTGKFSKLRQRRLGKRKLRGAKAASLHDHA